MFLHHFPIRLESSVMLVTTMCGCGFPISSRIYWLEIFDGRKTESSSSARHTQPNQGKLSVIQYLPNLIKMSPILPARLALKGQGLMANIFHISSLSPVCNEKGCCCFLILQCNSTKSLPIVSLRWHEKMGEK